MANPRCSPSASLNTRSSSEWPLPRSTRPPEPTTVLIVFEGGAIDRDGFVLSDTTLTTRQIGVASGAAAGQSVDNSLAFTRADADSFDFEGSVFTAVNRKKVTLTIEGFLDGVSVGTKSYQVRDNAETNLSRGDAIFDEVVRVLITESGGVIVDGLVLKF